MKAKNKLDLCVLLLFISFSIVKNDNSTECYKMYLNKTINNNCFNETACCYYDYIINSNVTHRNCVEKLNNTEDLCLQYSRLFTYHPSAIFGKCDCNSSFFVTNFTLIVFLVLSILSIL